MTENKKILNDMMKRQDEYLHRQIELEKAKKSYELRELEKFDKSIIEMLRTPKKKGETK